MEKEILHPWFLEVLIRFSLSTVKAGGQVFV